MTTATSPLSRAFAKLLAGGQLELPTMPGTAAEVLELCQQEGTDAARLSAVLHRDPTIASHVLRVANSAALVGQVGCASLQQAVSRLGMQRITEIAMAVSVRGSLFGNALCAQLLAELWRHSVVTAYFTKEIARLRRRNVEIAFLCGLLHDIGKAVLLHNLSAALGDEEPSADPQTLVDAVLEQHVAAGLQLAAAWRLPAQIAEAIGNHHEPAAAEHFQDLAATVALADLLGHLVAPGAFGAAPDAAELRLHPLLATLNLYPDQFEGLLQQRERALQLAEGMQ